MRPFENPTSIEWRYAPLNYLIKHNFHTLPLDLPLELTVSANQELIFENSKATFTGLYQCLKSGSEQENYIVEVLDADVVGFKQIANYEFKEKNSEEAMEISNSKYKMSTTWSDWTQCNACGLVGKRFKYGICMIFSENSSAHKAEELENSKQVPSEISCNSKFLPTSLKGVLSKYDITPKILLDYCKVPCLDIPKNDTIDIKQDAIKNLTEGGLDALFRSIPEQFRVPVRISLIVSYESRQIFNCPGWVLSNIPVIWRKDLKEIVPELIYEKSNGRIEIDLLQRLIFNKSLPYDSGIYTCWQWDKPAGIISFKVRSRKLRIDNYLAPLLAISVIFLIIFICRRISRRREQVKRQTSKKELP